MVRGWTLGQKHKILLSTPPPPFPPGGVTPTQPSVFKKTLAVTNGCVGVIVLSKILSRMALPQGPTSYPFIYHFSMKGYNPFRHFLLEKLMVAFHILV